MALTFEKELVLHAAITHIKPKSRLEDAKPCLKVQKNAKTNYPELT